MDNMRQLFEEINRLLLSPYRVSFKKLSAVVNDTGRHALQAWARGNPCQVERLAAVILDSFEVELFSLDIIRLLSCALPFRDAILEQKPTLLDILLTNATTSKSGFHKYAATCTALLSAPLKIPEPATLPEFITKLLDQAVQDSSADSIRSIYLVFSGLTVDWLDTLPIDLLIRLQDQLVDKLRAPGVGDPNLTCLAILAKLASAESTICISDQQSSLNDRSSPQNTSSIIDDPARKVVDRYSHARQFFTAKRSGKTLELVMLKVILACSRNSTMTVNEAIESLKYSEKIVDVMSSGEKRSWLLKNGTRVKKLYEKVLRQDIVVEVQCAAMSFIATMIQAESLPPELITTFRGLLQTSVPLNLMQKAIEKYIIQLDESTICDTVWNLLELACSEAIPSQEALTRVENAIVIISGLVIRIEDSATLRQAILYSLSTNELSESLHRFLSPKHSLSTTAPHGNVENCPHSYHQTKLDLQRKICNLFLKTALHASQDELGIDASTATYLLDKQMHFPSYPIQCNFYKSQRLASAATHLPFQEARIAPSEFLSSRGWRDTMRENMSKVTNYQHQSIVRMVEDICQDLEFRCEDFERPLRDEQARSRDLEEKLKASGSRITELECQAQERVLALDGLELERTRLADQVQVAGQQLEGLLSTRELLQQEIDQTKKEATYAANAAQEELKRQQLAQLAIIAGKDEIYEERTSTLVELESRIKRLEDELMQMRVQEEDAKVRINTLETLCCEKSKAAETAMQLAVSRLTEIDHLIELEANSVTERNQLSCKLEEFEEQCELLKAELHSRTAAFTKDISDLRRVRDEQLSVKAEEAESQRASYENTTQRLRERLVDAKKNAALAAKQNSQLVVGLEKEIVMLRQVQERRANEFAEAQELSSKLMDVMRLMQPQSNPLDVQNIKGKQASGFQVGHLSCGSDASASTPPFFRSTTSSKNGHTIKRTKLNRNFKSPISHRANTVIKATNGKSNQTSTTMERRVPLKNLDDTIHNMKDSTPISASHRRKTQMLGNEDVPKENRDIDYTVSFGNLSFDDNDVFTSISQQQLSGESDEAATETFDNTSADF